MGQIDGYVSDGSDQLEVQGELKIVEVDSVIHLQCHYEWGFIGLGLSPETAYDLVRLLQSIPAVQTRIRVDVEVQISAILADLFGGE